MTDTSTVLKNQYQGNASATSFDYQFKILSAEELVVVKTGADGVNAELTLNVDYSISGVGENNGGSIVYPLSGSALAANEKITLYPNYSLTQTLDFTNQDKAYFELFEEGLDRANLKVKMLKEQVDRAIKVSVTSNASPDDYLDEAAGYALQAAQSATDADTAKTAAEAAATAAEAAETAAAASAAIAEAATVLFDFPAPDTPYANMIPSVNAAGDEYELDDTVNIDKTNGGLFINDGSNILQAGFNSSDIAKIGTTTNQVTRLIQNDTTKIAFPTNGHIYFASEVDTDPSSGQSGLTMYPTGAAGAFHMVINNPAGGVPLALNKGGDGTTLSFYRHGSSIGAISVTSTGTYYNTSSDYRLKDNIAPLENGLSRLNALRPLRFNFLIDPDKMVDGFLAHEVQDIVPEAATGTKDEMEQKTIEFADGTSAVIDEPLYQSIDPSKMVPLLVAAVQELASKVALLEQQSQS